VDIRPLLLRLTEVVKHPLFSRCSITEHGTREVELLSILVRFPPTPDVSEVRTPLTTANNAGMALHKKSRESAEGAQY